MQLISPVDASFLYLESRATPQHVSVLQTFALPADAPEDFLRRLVQHFRDPRQLVAPWNLRLASPLLGRWLPAWRIDGDVDLEYHVRFCALPRPGGERALGEQVSLLHAQPLDPSRPMWECTLIEGLEGDRFALVMKMHHALIDGVSAARLMGRVFSTNPAARDLPPPWATAPPAREPRADSAPAPARKSPRGLRSLLRLGRTLAGMSLESARPGAELKAPFSCPDSPLNARITAARRVATQQYDLARLKALARATDCTLNDLILYLAGSALRRFLDEAGALPSRALTAGLPVSLRLADDQGTGNAISFMFATLGSDIADPRQRLAAIRASTSRAKTHLQALPRELQTPYVLLLMAPSTLQQGLGFGGRTPPNHNITISNVPGPAQALYLNGARMESMYPLGMPAHGLALNITCLSYAGTFNIGLISCRDALPHMQRIAVYMGEALDELEKLA
ncbi:MAG TPA: wax ester/triacylglycerol synthase family O-acyltransferase [Solimonas sp.]|nr:wax ester/triacylglycerol synthase family O-acyltransferase [Solimonas sp.]